MTIDYKKFHSDNVALSIDNLKEYLSQGADINHQNENGNTVLIRAASKNKIGVVKFLLSNGANVNIQNKEGKTALYRASSLAHLGDKPVISVVKQLLLHGADPNLIPTDPEEKGSSSLITHIKRQENIEIVKLMIKQKANVNYQDDLGNTALYYASSPSCIHFLMLCGVDMSLKNKKGLTVLEDAIEGSKNLEKHISTREFYKDKIKELQSWLGDEGEI